MKNIKFKSVALLLLCTTLTLSAEDNLDIDSLLSDIENKTDLSEKTKLENSGISIIYTRSDIERMQARYLKDILKSNYSFGYNENRSGIPDPLTLGMNLPFASSSMRVFIDNQEIISGLYGSGLASHGNIDLGFVDHIEIYTQSPTYEYSTEPTLTLIKLYSKSIEKDEGSKVEVNTGNLGGARVSGYTSQYLNNDWSFLSYVSLENEKRETHYSFGKDLSRNKKSTHIFTSFKHTNHNILIDYYRTNNDGFIGPSMDATPLTNKLYNDNLHVGYDGNIDNFYFLATYDYITSDYSFHDDVEPNPYFDNMFPLQSKTDNTKSTTLTAELKHKYKTEKNSLTTGIKYRYKDYKYTKLETNGIIFPTKSNESQTLTTLFAQNEYSLLDNLILTGGVQYAYVYSEDSPYDEDNNLFLYRLALTYTSGSLVLKTLYSHSESPLDPYLIDSFYINKNIDNSESDAIYEDIIFTSDNSKYEFILGYTQTKNYLMPINLFGHLDNYNETIDMYSTVLRWEYNYNEYDKLFTEFSFQQIENYPGLSSYKIYKAVVRNLNTYGKFDIFNEIIYDSNNINYNNFFDYSAGVKYSYTKDLILSIKGENILHQAKESQYMRINPDTFQALPSLSISPIDRKFTISMEYLF